MILAGDVGGTKAILALAEHRDGGLEIVRERSYATREHAGLAAIVRAFLAEGGESVDRAALGLACPVVGGRCEMTNLGWTVERGALGDALGIERLAILNDLEATAYGIDDLPPDRIATVHAGVERSPTRALLAAGTGLGAAIATRIDGRLLVLPTEAGHVDYAPRTPDEVALMEWLRATHGRVSFERVVSGPGLHAVYRFLRDTGRAEEPPWLAERIDGTGDPSAVISEVALEGGAEICERALGMFAAAYGAAAGNLALASLALGGVYLGGGIAPKILPALDGDGFVDAFVGKGRMEDLVADVPVRVILEPRTALIGAARYALLTDETPGPAPSTGGSATPVGV